MSPSDDSEEDDPASAAVALVDDLDDDPVAVAGELTRTYVGNPECYAPDAILPEGAVATLTDLLDHDHPRVRAHVVCVLRQSVVVTLWNGEMDRDTAELVETLLERADDPDWRVRQPLLASHFCDQIAAAVVEGRADELGVTLASVLVDRLRDEVATIRQRAGEALVGYRSIHVPYDDKTFDHAAELLLHHPDPEAATGDLVATLDDETEGVVRGRGRRPRSTAGTVLVALAEHRPDLVKPHADDLARHLQDDDWKLRLDVAEALERVLPRDPEALAPVGNAVAPLLTADVVAWRLRAAEVLHRIADDVDLTHPESPVDWDETAFLDACLASLEESHVTYLERGSTLLGSWLPEFDDAAIERALGVLQAEASDRPEPYVAAIDGVLAVARCKEPPANAISVLEALAGEDPGRAREAIDDQGGPSAFPPAVHRAVGGTE